MGGFLSVARPFPAREGAAAAPPLPGPDATTRRCRCARQPMGAEEVGLLAAVTLPGTGARRLGARELPPRHEP